MNNRVLLVDDDVSQLRLLEKLLPAFKIETATFPLLALDLIELRGPYAVVCADFEMPKLNGEQFLSRVRGLSPSTDRLMLTGQQDFLPDDAALVTEVLRKPCRGDVLAQAIQAAVVRYSQRKPETCEAV